MELTTTQRYTFQAVHSLPGEETTHGHHYFVELSFHSCSRHIADLAFNDYVKQKLHGQNLDAEFTPATGERLVEWIDESLRSSPLGPYLLAVTLQETAKNRFVSSQSEVRFV